MEKDYFTQTLTETVKALSQSDSLNGLCLQHRDSHPIPSGETLNEVIALARAILFPGYYGESTINTKTISYHIGVNMERLQKLLEEQIFAALCIADCSEQIDAEVNWRAKKRLKRLPQNSSCACPPFAKCWEKTLRRPTTATLRPRAWWRLSAAIRHSKHSLIIALHTNYIC